MEIKLKNSQFRCNEVLMIRSNNYSDGDIIRKWHKQLQDHLGKLTLEWNGNLEKLNFEEKEIELQGELYESISSLRSII